MENKMAYLFVMPSAFVIHTEIINDNRLHNLGHDNSFGKVFGVAPYLYVGLGMISEIGT